MGLALADELRGFGPLGLLSIIVVVVAGNVGVGPILFPLGAALTLIWVRLSRTRWHDVGYVAPKSWVSCLLLGVAAGFVFKLAMKALVMPLLGAPPTNQAFQYLVGNREALPAAIWAMFVAGFGEETVFRGFLFERLGRLLGQTAWSKVGIVLGTSIFFGLVHYPLQGLPGVEQATIVGLVFASVFAVTGRLVPLMVAHTAFDLTALAIIYWDLESEVARLILK